MSFTSIKVRLEERRWLKAEAARREMPMYQLMAELVSNAQASGRCASCSASLPASGEDDKEAAEC